MGERLGIQQSHPLSRITVDLPVPDLPVRSTRFTLSQPFSIQAGLHPAAIRAPRRGLDESLLPYPFPMHAALRATIAAQRSFEELNTPRGEAVAAVEAENSIGLFAE